MYVFHFDVWFELMYAVFVHQYIAILMYKRRKSDVWVPTLGARRVHDV